MAQLTAEACQRRRQRLLQSMESARVDACLLTDVRDIYYFTGQLLPADLPAMWLVGSDGRGRLVGPAGTADRLPDDGAAEWTSYEWNYQGTRHPFPLDHMLHVAGGLASSLGAARVGFQQAAAPARVCQQITDEIAGDLVPFDEPLADMQQRKDSDEVDVIRASIRANLGAYQAVSEAIRPGVTELEVLAAGIGGAMATAGEKVFHDGDYQCGAYNGPARNRRIERGELYIVDAWTTYRGYWSDMSRTFVVGSEPTDVQQALFDHIRSVQQQIPALLRPGADGSDVFAALDALIREHPPLATDGLIHHGGHCTGLRAHEMPDINPQRGGEFEPGNVVCVEPGGYFEAARYGVRLENIYLITADGCEDLCPGDVQLLRCG